MMFTRAVAANQSHHRRTPATELGLALYRSDNDNAEDADRRRMYAKLTSHSLIIRELTSDRKLHLESGSNLSPNASSNRDSSSNPSNSRRLRETHSIRNFYWSDNASEFSGQRTFYSELILCQVQGKEMYQLELHFPYFALRERPPEENISSNAKPNWIDLGFLNTDTCNSNPTTYVIHQAHFSLVIYGFHNSRWVAYAFENNQFDEGYENGLEDEEECYSYETFNEDPIVSEAKSGIILDANVSISDPRVYFLWVLSARIHQQSKFWEDLVRYLEPSIDRYVRHCFNLMFRGSYANGLLERPTLVRTITGSYLSKRSVRECEENSRSDPTAQVSPSSAIGCPVLYNQGVGDIQR